MKITHLSSDNNGGAARAANRIHNAIISQSSHVSNMLLRFNNGDDWRIATLNSKVSNHLPLLYQTLDYFPARFQHADSIPRSPAWFSSINVDAINKSDSDLIHLHWICNGFVSIKDIARFTKPLVWTLHDMWAFCGAEHLASDDPEARWRRGYSKENRDPRYSGIDVDRWTWNRKLTRWKRRIEIVAPSRWLANCAKGSVLMKDWNITCIPNPIDTALFKPISKIQARKILNLPLEPRIILFGAIKGIQLSYKGWDLLEPALKQFSSKNKSTNVVVFGQKESQEGVDLGMPTYWLGHLHDDYSLALVYSAADVMVVPSRQEAFGQTASEAQACGCPVVAFGATGLLDIVEHGETGYLAEPYSSEDLSKGIEWVLADEERHAKLSVQARVRAIRLWSYQVVIPQYLDVYRKAVVANKNIIKTLNL